jgi:SAM-dependent methyltransferase
MNFVCPTCGQPLARGDDDLLCGTCNERFPVRHGVPVLIAGTRVERRSEGPAQGFAGSIAAIASEAGQAQLEALEEAFRLKFAFPNPVIQSESAQFLDRLRSSGVAVTDPYPQPAAAQPAGAADRQGSVRMSVRIVTFPQFAAPSEFVSFNVQLSNTGTARLSSAGPRPLQLCCQLMSERGDVVTERRTPLLIDLDPGRTITQAMVLEAPPDTGHVARYRASIRAILGNEEWLPEAASTHLVVTYGRSPEHAVWETGTRQRSYGEDHHWAVELLQSWLADLGREPQAIVEIGGNCRPSTVPLGKPMANVDVDPFGLMTAAILFNREPVTHVVADGTRLPFADHSLDAITMFATFHHFPDPVGLLSHLRSKLKPDGMLFLMCEPTGHPFRDTVAEGYLRELSHGAYEQSFQPWEYMDFLNRSGFVAQRALLDVGSAKIAARPFGYRAA